MSTIASTTSASPNTLRLTVLHAKYILLETFRVPMAVVGALAFPALSLLFFVVPNRTVANDPLYATQAVISLSVFALMANSLFSFGLSVAENREQPWDPYLRTLPATGVARVFAQLCSTGMLGLVAILPVVLLGWVATAATASPLRVLAGIVALAIGALPFMFIGICLGYSMPMKAAIAVVQVVMFTLAFGGGLFLPPQMFAPWLDTVSKFLPSRQARELVVWAVQGGDLPWWSWVGVLAWGAVMLTVALILFRRDEGRRFR